MESLTAKLAEEAMVIIGEVIEREREGEREREREKRYSNNSIYSDYFLAPVIKRHETNHLIYHIQYNIYHIHRVVTD